MSDLRVLMAGYEIAPFYKRGGLGDVMASLPKALTKEGLDVRIVVPHYAAIRKELLGSEKRIGQFYIHFGKGEEEIGVYKTYLPDTKIIVYFLSNKPNLAYLNRRGRNKKIDQFAFFDLAVSHFVPYLSKEQSWEPKVVHCNDWQTALVPLILKKKVSLNLPTIFTIHNLNYQGKGSLKVLDLLHIKDEDTREIKRGKPVTEINVLGEGIIHATKVSTVSPTYAKEIVEDYDSDPIHYFLKRREKERGVKDEVIGILNGIDYDIWNPKLDEEIFHKYDIDNCEDGKRNNKEDLLKTLSLDNRPTFCFIGRMAKQKGIDLLVKAVKRLSKVDFNLIFLGTGDPNIEKSIMRISKSYPSNIKGIFSYDEDIAHKLYAGSDFIIIPSHYEPCGLIQMVAMKYGTIPLASETGGLKDSIASGKNGILFKKNSVSSLIKALKEALLIYNNPNKLKSILVSAMKTDFSWDKSAILYRKLYERLLRENNV
ncbi:MAG: glycogen/starch synthase [Patescibacteria group bacterium]